MISPSDFEASFVASSSDATWSFFQAHALSAVGAGGANAKMNSVGSIPTKSIAGLSRNESTGMFVDDVISTLYPRALSWDCTISAIAGCGGFVATRAVILAPGLTPASLNSAFAFCGLYEYVFSSDLL